MRYVPTCRAVGQEEGQELEQGPGNCSMEQEKDPGNGSMEQGRPDCATEWREQHQVQLQPGMNHGAKQESWSSSSGGVNGCPDPLEPRQLKVSAGWIQHQIQHPAGPSSSSKQGLVPWAVSQPHEGAGEAAPLSLVTAGRRCGESSTAWSPVNPAESPESWCLCLPESW